MKIDNYWNVFQAMLMLDEQLMKHLQFGPLLECLISSCVHKFQEVGLFSKGTITDKKRVLKILNYKKLYLKEF